MSAQDPDDAEVVYSVKELLSEMRRDWAEGTKDLRKEQAEGFTRIETAMSGKADKADLVRMQGAFERQFAEHGRELESHQSDIDRLKDAHRTREQWWRLGKAVMSAAVSVGVILGGLGAAGLIHFH